MQSLMSLLGKAFFKLSGWAYDDKPELWQDKQVVVGFPHTTNMDGVRVLTLFYIIKIRASTLVKKEAFKGPMGVFLRAMGCIAVDRKSSTNLVDKMASIFAEREKFTLAIAPEGTRTPSGQKPPIKTGFWRIAKAAGVPIVFLMSDSATKRGRFLGKIIPGESMEDDLRHMQKLYSDAGVDLVIPE